MRPSPLRLLSRRLADDTPGGGPFRSHAGVKEPLFRSLNDGSYYIRIEAPSDFVRLYPRSSPVDFPKGPAGSSTTASAPPIHWLAGLDARGLKTAGDKAYSDRRYVRAKEAYEQALDALGGEAAAETSEAEPDLRARVYANLAQTYLNLDLPRLASRATENGRKDLEAASAAASDPPSTSNLLLLRLLYRAALGNYRADRDAAALQHLQDLLRRDPSNGEAEALLARVQTRQHQAGQGPDADALRNLWSSSVDMQRRGRRVPSSQPDIANWISPDLAIEPVSGKGNGLVASRAVRRGELLMCVKPLACARGPRAGQLRYTAGVNLWTESEDPWAVGEVVSELLWQAALEGDAREEDGTASRLAPLWAGPDLGRCHKVADSPPGPSHVEGAVTFNGFHVEELSASTLEDGDPSLRSRADPDDLFHAPTALYPEHSSALNHSCVANCTYSFVNSVFLLRARVDIKEGEELVDSYVDATDPLEARRSKLAVHGFVCACALCAEEVAVSAETRRRRVELVRVAQKQAKGDADALQNIVAELEATYPASVRTKPALYTPLRLLSQALAAADSGSTASSSSAIANELKALECLGAVFSGSEGTEILAEPPRLRDMDGVLSALWIATEWQRRGRTEACRYVLSRLAKSLQPPQLILTFTRPSSDTGSHSQKRSRPAKAVANSFASGTETGLGSTV